MSVMTQAIGWWRDPKATSKDARAWIVTLPETTADKFNRLRAVWEQATLIESSVAVAVGHSAYRQIVAMGWDVVPYIIQSFVKSPNHWHVALVEITGEDPVSEENAGDLQAMAKDWLDWAIKKGVVPA